MLIAFFHSGPETTLPEAFCQSARLNLDPSCSGILHLTDESTPKIDGATDVFRMSSFDPDRVMYSRMRAYSEALQQFDETICFFDTDMLITSSFTVSVDGDRPILCRRSFYRDMLLRADMYNDFGKTSFPEHAGRVIDHVYPYVGCFLAARGSVFVDLALEAYSRLDERYQYWYGDQVAIREAAKIIEPEVVDEAVIACLPEFAGKPGREEVIAYHFKGARKKQVMGVLSEIAGNKRIKKINIEGAQSPIKARKKTGYSIKPQFNPYFRELLVGNESANVEFDSAENLDLSSRADVLCKVVYALCRLNLVDYEVGRALYLKHISALNGGAGKDSPEKRSPEQYLSDFDALLKEVIVAGHFSEEKSVVPVSSDRTLIDGAHRTAIALATGIPLPLSRLPVKHTPKIGLDSLRQRFALSDSEMGLVMRAFLRFQPSARIFLLFPARDRSRDERALHLLSRYYQVNFRLNLNLSKSVGMAMFKNLYAGAEWIGGNSNDYAGADWKAQCTAVDQGPIDVIICSPYDERMSAQDAVKDLKERVREIYEIGFHGIHGTDNREENLHFFDTIALNNPIVEASNIGFDVKLSALNSEQIRFLDFLAEQPIGYREKVVLSGGMVLAALGLRETADIDWISDVNEIPYGESHEQFLAKYTGHTVVQILSDPANTFQLMYRGKLIKFLSLNIIKALKTRKNDASPTIKDGTDIELLRQIGI